MAWLPAETDTAFRVQLGRYYYGAEHVLKSALALPARRGTGARLVAPFTAGAKMPVIQIGNTLASSVNVAVTVYDATETAATVQPGTAAIRVKGTRHIILNDYLASGTGNV